MINENEFDSVLRDVHFYKNGEGGPTIIFITGSEMTSLTDEIMKESVERLPYVLCELTVDDWDANLTPWPAGECLKGRNFSGMGGRLLRYIEGTLVPYIRTALHTQDIYICGYSLAGLFAIWALHESSMLKGAVCCSGSLWYPGYEKYMTEHSFGRNVSVYLSLGDKEPLTKHQLMKQIGDITQNQYELLKSDKMVDSVFFEWQSGGHFTAVAKRIARGIRVILEGTD